MKDVWKTGDWLILKYEKGQIRLGSMQQKNIKIDDDTSSHVVLGGEHDDS